MDKREALEILRTYALDGVYDDNRSGASARAEARIDEAYDILNEGLVRNEYTADNQEKDDALEQLLLTYNNGEEKFRNLRPLTIEESFRVHQEEYRAYRERLLYHLAREDLSDRMKQEYGKELEEFDAWYAKVSSMINDSE